MSRAKLFPNDDAQDPETLPTHIQHVRKPQKEDWFPACVSITNVVAWWNGANGEVASSTVGAKVEQKHAVEGRQCNIIFYACAPYIKNRIASAYDPLIVVSETKINLKLRPAPATPAA